MAVMAAAAGGGGCPRCGSEWERASACDGSARGWQALFLFLKFISSVIPTVEYDFTMDFDA
eukprot:2898967-Rhodomonas_salina.1